MKLNQPTIFDDYLSRWQLIQDGELIITHSSQLLPVRYQNTSAILKIATSDEERWGALLMVWWEGDGAAPVLLHEGDALLMERALGTGSLIEMAENGHDDEASRIICSVVQKLHAHKDNPPKLLPLSLWFKRLEVAASQFAGLFSQAFTIANELLSAPEDLVVLHGDIHHGNILDFGSRGWLAIDPKHLIGERGFDYANLFSNPNQIIATHYGRLSRQVQIVADAAQLDKNRLLKWILAYSALSAAWSIDDGESPDLALAITELAATELRK
jgi:streptomycin 6-kinase